MKTQEESNWADPTGFGSNVGRPLNQDDSLGFQLWTDRVDNAL